MFKTNQSLKLKMRIGLGSSSIDDSRLYIMYITFSRDNFKQSVVLSMTSFDF